jgi:hypothetical protein
MIGPPVSLFLDSSDLDALVTIRPNVLLLGDRAAADGFLAALPSRFSAGIREIGIAALRPGSQMGLRTAVLRNVAEYNQADQQVLLAWLEERGRDCQLISTTDRPLFELVACGEFDARLFYRLNMMFVDLNGRSG